MRAMFAIVVATAGLRPPARTVRAHVRAAAEPRCAEIPYYTDREARQLKQAQRAVARTAGGAVCGAIGGAGLKAVEDAVVELVPWASALDLTFDLAAGLLFGGILGVLWATEVALLRSGGAGDYLRDQLRPLMRDGQSADEALEAITLGLGTMARRGDAALRIAYQLTGLDEAEAVASIAAAAGAAPSPEAVVAAYERTLEGKLARARLVFLGQGVGLGLGAHGALWASGRAVEEVSRAARLSWPS